MRLYHGTNAAYLPSILEHGIRPRGEKGRTNWVHTIESNPDTVYLTDTYAHFFAYQATMIEKGETPAIIEVETDLIDPEFGHLVPDEDALEQCTRRLSEDEKIDAAMDNGWVFPPAELDGDMQARTRWFRDRTSVLADFWVGSLKALGTCGFLGIVPPVAITRVAILKDCESLALPCLDAQISALNFKFAGEHHKNLLRAFMGDWEEVTAHPMAAIMDPDDPTGGYRRMLEDTGVEVHGALELDEQLETAS